MCLSNPRSLFGTVIAILVFTLPLQAEAAKKPKIQSDKEAVILLPLVVSEEARSMASEMQAAVVQGLQHKYLVYSGERVLQELKKATEKQNHSVKLECDETRCLQDIAIAFQTEYVAVAHINKIEGGYLLSISIKGVISNEAVYDNSLPCKGCDAFAVIDKLKELVGAPAAVASAPAPEAPQPQISQNDPDTVLWEEVKKGNVAEDFQAYLTQFPKGKFVALAKTKLTRLKDEARAAFEQHDQQAWSTAQQGNSQDSYATYLSQYSQGQFAALAQSRIDKIKREAEATPKGVVSQGDLTWMPVSFYKKWIDANAYCHNTAIYGQTGWRLPAKEELIALYNSGAMKNQGWILHLTWSSTPNGSDAHFYVSMSGGGVGSAYDSSTDYVTCVRESSPMHSEQAEFPKANFVSQGGLTWMPVSFNKTWEDANAYCTNTSINGQTGWRLPTKDELKALYDSGTMNNHGLTLSYTWSSTPGGSGEHYTVILGNGHVVSFSDTRNSHVTCVHI